MSALTVITHVELGSASDIVLSSISGSFTDLLLIASIRTQDENPFIGFRVNNINSGISTRGVSGDGSSPLGAFTRSDDYIGAAQHANATANTFGTLTVYIPDYSTSTTKTISYELFGATANTTCFQQSGGAIYPTTAAVSSLRIYNWGATNLTQFSSATLYGITKGSSGGVTVS